MLAGRVPRALARAAVARTLTPPGCPACAATTAATAVPWRRPLSSRSRPAGNGADEYGDADADAYESPLRELFEQMARNETSLGTRAPLEDDTGGPPRTLACGVPEAALRFTTTCHGRTMNAPFVQPREHAVALKVHLDRLPLDGLEREILREIVGRRADGHELRLQSHQFASRIENKRHLVSQLERLVESCRRLAREVHAAAAEAAATTTAPPRQGTEGSA